MTFRAIPVLASLLAAACVAGGEDTAPSDQAGADSTMVVASEPEVPSESVQPDDGRPVVVFLGTSLTAGLGLERDEETWVSGLAAIGDSVGLPFRAVNAGVSGETSAGGLRRIDWVLRDPLDVLVVELGANDGLRGQDPQALRANLTEVIRRTRARYPDADIVLTGMEAPPNLGPMYTSAFRAIFPEVAEAEGVLLVPFLLDGVAGVPELNQQDRIHPTAAGHRRMAETVWPFLEPLLERHR